MQKKTLFLKPRHMKDQENYDHYFIVILIYIHMKDRLKFLNKLRNLFDQMKQKLNISEEICVPLYGGKGAQNLNNLIPFPIFNSGV